VKFGQTAARAIISNRASGWRDRGCFFFEAGHNRFAEYRRLQRLKKLRQLGSRLYVPYSGMSVNALLSESGRESFQEFRTGT
jgi:hypothetical protein